MMHLMHLSQRPAQGANPPRKTSGKNNFPSPSGSRVSVSWSASSDSDSGSVYSDFAPSHAPSSLEDGGYAGNGYLYQGYRSDEDMTEIGTLNSELTPENSRSPSLFSYDSGRDAAEMLKEENGRTFNNQNDTYYLPADEREFNRLGLQHKIHLTVLGGLYPAPELVESALAPQWGTEKSILDVGTGPGHWAVDMARKFPHCSVVGVDLAPRTSFPEIPTNLRLEFDDANLGFPHYHGCFDVVHARSMSTGINDYDAFVLDLTRCLRPGGVLILIDGEVQVLGENKLPFQPAFVNGTYPETKGWFARILYEASRGMTARRARVLTNCTAALIRAMQSTRALAHPHVYTMHTPLGPWPVGATDAETRWIQHIGEMMRTNACEFMHTLRPMLKAQGFTDAAIDIFLDGAQRELGDLTVHMYSRWAYGYAVKAPVAVGC